MLREDGEDALLNRAHHFRTSTLPIVAARRCRRWRDEDGFTFAEIALVCLVIGVLSAIVSFTLSNAITAGKADGGAAKVREALERARELAATNRADVEVVFTADNRLVIQRVDWSTDPFERVLVEEYTLESGVTFKLFGEIEEDTPNTFGRGAPVTFAVRTVGDLDGPTITFTSEGSCVDAVGDPVNGTIFMGMGNRVETARAITVMGATAGLQTWRWHGTSWTD